MHPVNYHLEITGLGISLLLRLCPLKDFTTHTVSWGNLAVMWLVLAVLMASGLCELGLGSLGQNSVSTRLCGHSHGS